MYSDIIELYEANDIEEANKMLATKEWKLLAIEKKKAKYVADKTIQKTEFLIYILAKYDPKSLYVGNEKNN